VGKANLGENNENTDIRRPKMISPIYPWVRARQLEGTWPGSPRTGVCVSTNMRVVKGWGQVEEELWPDDGKTWPIIEPKDIDIQAKSNRIGAYQRVNTVEECRKGLDFYGGVLASFEIDDSWYKAPKGVISPPGNQQITGVHCIPLLGYSNKKKRFVFINSWGSGWGRRGLGFLPYSYFPSRFIEGYIITIPNYRYLTRRSSQIELHNWGFKTKIGDILHGIDIVDHEKDEVIGWGFAVEHNNTLDLEDLFVRPRWRRMGYGTLIATEYTQLATVLGKRLRAWVPHPDAMPMNEEALKKIIQKLGLTKRSSPVRWAAAIGE